MNTSKNNVVGVNGTEWIVTVERIARTVSARYINHPTLAPLPLTVDANDVGAVKLADAIMKVAYGVDVDGRKVADETTALVDYIIARIDVSNCAI